MTTLLVNASSDVTVLSIDVEDKLEDLYHQPGKVYYIEPDSIMVKVTQLYKVPALAILIFKDQMKNVKLLERNEI
uniref:SERPIN domain-containing protein n=1 Tax=Strongyloides papillosus TaxID=174720 RepID=A0A0N5C5J5_STREA